MGDTGTMTSGAVVVSRKPLSSDGLKETRAPSNDPNIRTLGIYQASNVMLPKRLVFTRHRANKANKTDKAGRTTKDEAPAFQNFAGLKYKAGVSQDKFEDEFSCVGVLMDVVNIRDGTSVPTGVTIQAAGLTSVISNTLTPIQVGDQLRWRLPSIDIDTRNAQHDKTQKENGVDLCAFLDVIDTSVLVDPFKDVLRAMAAENVEPRSLSYNNIVNNHNEGPDHVVHAGLALRQLILATAFETLQYAIMTGMLSINAHTHERISQLSGDSSTPMYDRPNAEQSRVLMSLLSALQITDEKNNSYISQHLFRRCVRGKLNNLDTQTYRTLKNITSMSPSEAIRAEHVIESAVRNASDGFADLMVNVMQHHVGKAVSDSSRTYTDIVLGC